MPLCFIATLLYCLAFVLCQRMTSMTNCGTLDYWQVWKALNTKQLNLASLLIQIVMFNMEAFFYIQVTMLVLQACWKTNTTHTTELPWLHRGTWIVPNNCQSMWHSPSFDGVRGLWFAWIKAAAAAAAAVEPTLPEITGVARGHVPEDQWINESIMEITGRDHFENCTYTSYQFNIRDIQLAFLFCCTSFYCMLFPSQWTREHVPDGWGDNC